jgi:TolB-like protein/DNA-binding winged helix-turn-helix (wHTH) protein
MTPDTAQFAQFGTFVLDLKQRILTREGEFVQLAPKDLEVLLVLVRGYGQIVEKKEFIESIWPDTFVEEANLSRHIFNLRQALSANGERSIETVPKRGYRFVAATQFHSETPLASTASRPVAIDDLAVANDARTSLAIEPPGTIRSGGTSSVPRMILRPRALVLAFAAFLAAGVIFGLLRARPVHRVSIVILPIQNLSGDPSKDYIADGLTEELISRAASLKSGSLTVIPFTSSMALKTSTKNAAQIGQDLQVDYLVEGTLRESPGRFRVSVKLIWSPGQKLVWVREYDHAPADPIGMQDEISEAVVKLLPTSASSLSAE